MTSLDTILSTMKAKWEFIAAVQNTPQNILFVVNTENFWQGLKILDQNSNIIRLRFLEEREQSLDIHFSVTIRGALYQVAFRIVDYSSLIFNELVKCFPHTSIFIEEIKEES
ncbi:MAG: hypothetical protein ACFFFH_12830 [Candidatus Thorarchaeota archaeon]